MIGSDPVGRCSRFSGLAMAIRFGFGERSISYACFSVLSAHNWFPFGDLVGRCGIMHHINILTCGIDTIEWLLSFGLGDRAEVLFFFFFKQKTAYEITR